MPETTSKLTRSEQSRINGAKSKGPVTAAGKAISSANALKHGFAATINVVLTIEDEPAFHEHLAGVRAAFNPTNYFEQTLIDQLANISWRLLGVWRPAFDYRRRSPHCLLLHRRQRR